MSKTLQETDDSDEFKQFLQSEFKVADPEAQDLIVGLFSFNAIKSVHDLGLLTSWSPIGAARQRLIDNGIPNPQEVYPFLGQD